MISSTLIVPSSVLQESKLRPLLLILCINDIINNFHYAKVRMISDDQTIYAIVNDFQDKENFKSELSKLVKWDNIWRLEINFKKFHVIHLGTKKQ